MVRRGLVRWHENPSRHRGFAGFAMWKGRRGAKFHFATEIRLAVEWARSSPYLDRAYHWVKFEETEIEWVELVAELERSMLRNRIILGYASINSEKPMFAGVEFVAKQGRSMPAPLRGRGEKA